MSLLNEDLVRVLTADRLREAEQMRRRRQMVATLRVRRRSERAARQAQRICEWATRRALRQTRAALKLSP
jgi:hypothetical protein